jgi:hypothetical protein
MEQRWIVTERATGPVNETASENKRCLATERASGIAIEIAICGEQPGTWKKVQSAAWRPTTQIEVLIPAKAMVTSDNAA